MLFASLSLSQEPPLKDRGCGISLHRLRSTPCQHPVYNAAELNVCVIKSKD